MDSGDMDFTFIWECDRTGLDGSFCKEYTGF